MFFKSFGGVPPDLVLRRGGAEGEGEEEEKEGEEEEEEESRRAGEQEGSSPPSSLSAQIAKFSKSRVPRIKTTTFVYWKRGP